MSHKGRTFTEQELPASRRSTASGRMRMSPEEIKSWCEEQTERHRVVAYDSRDEALMAEELDQRALNELSPKARRAAGLLMNCDPSVRMEVLAAFQSDGSLIHPFKMVNS